MPTSECDSRKWHTHSLLAISAQIFKKFALNPLIKQTASARRVFAEKKVIIGSHPNTMISVDFQVKCSSSSLLTASAYAR